MEQDALRSAWQGMSGQPRSNTELKAMLQENKHPVLKQVRKQLVIEIAAFAAFLLVYYDLFDGHRKPLYANVLLVAAMLLAIIHSGIVYMLTKRRMKGDNIKQSLEGHLINVKAHAAVSVFSRALVAACLLLFFTTVITFTADKYWLLGGLGVLFIVQMVILSRIWTGRIRRMKELLAAL
jgi:uncharacterized membrane protein